MSNDRQPATHWKTHLLVGIRRHADVATWAHDRIFEWNQEMANAKESDERPDPVELDVCLLALASSYRQILRRLKKLEGRKALPGSLQEAATAYKRASDEFDIDRFRSLIEYEMEHVIGSTEAHYGAELRPAALGTRVLSVGTRLVDGIHASLHGVTFDLSTMQAPCERLRRDAVTTIWE